MPNSKDNPCTNLNFNGRRCRHAVQTLETRTIKTDRDSEHALALAKRLLAGDVAGDRSSVSLVVRRSLALYGRHLERINGGGTRGGRHRRFAYSLALW